MKSVVQLGGGVLLLMSSLVHAQTPPPKPAPVPAPVLGAWAVTTAPARFAIEPDDVKIHAPVSSVSLCLPRADWARTPMRVFTETGAAVGSEIIWTAPGEPTTILFDSSSGAKRYYVYPGSDWPAVPLKDARAGVLLESRAGDGKTINNLPDMLQAWNQAATTVNGRTALQGLFEGGNRFGPQGNILEHFRGWFEAKNQEHLELAAISSDASFVLVDGKDVVDWPGLHSFGQGMHGEHQGAVDLAPGIHFLDYYNAYVYGDRKYPMLCCLAAKGGELADWTMLSPGIDFFRPLAGAHVVNYQPQTTGSGAPAAAPPFAMDWAITEQSVIESEIANIGLISLQLTCRPSTAASVTWTFDDGTQARGQSVPHLFPRPGMRTVEISIADGGKTLGTLRQTISVHPNWTQLTTSPPQLTPPDRADILDRDPTTLSALDAAGCFDVFAVFKDADALLKLLPSVCDKLKAVGETDLPYIKDGAVFLARQDLPHFAEAGRLLRALADRCPPATPATPLSILGDQSRLALAQLTLETSDRFDEVRSLVAAINVPTLSGNEHRDFDILRGDLALATGDVVGARKQFEVLTGNPSGIDARSSIRRTSNIGHARAFIDRKDYEAAENSLDEVAEQAPVEKLSPEWALTQLRLYQEENLPVFASLWAKRLLPVITGNGRSELLFRITDLAFSQGDEELGRKSLAELLKDHPYSAEAAQAKEKWPGKA